MSLIIPLTQNKFAIVDDDDWIKVMQHRWYAHLSNGIWYAAKGGGIGNRQPLIRLHQFIMGINDADHRNRDGLDCRRDNLRPASRSQQLMNRRTHSKSGYKGVTINKGRYQVRIMDDTIGWFDDVIEAAKAYDEEAILRFGEFAMLNFAGGVS